MQVTVNAAANIPPVANAGSDQTITLPVNNVQFQEVEVMQMERLWVIHGQKYQALQAILL